MSNASTASQNLRDATSDTAREARDGMREVGSAAAQTSGNLQEDLAALRDEFSKLAEQVREIVSARGQRAWQRAMSGVDDVVAEARHTAGDATDAMRDVSDRVTGAIDDSLKERPYTTLAIAAGLGFLFGLTFRR